jgi:NTP pyrophosphatase (non-canonical NTP hydrolase)
MMTHEELVKTLKKPGEKILETLTPEKVDLWHMATLLVGEAAEILDAVKKHVVYNKELDLENIHEELGDVEFSLEGIRQILGLSRSSILEANKAKLMLRYKDGYSDSAAQVRQDKIEDFKYLNQETAS